MREEGDEAPSHRAHDGAAREPRPFADGALHRIGSETQKPLAVVVIGGLVTATLLVRFVLPVLYVAVSRRFGRGQVPKDET